MKLLTCSSVRRRLTAFHDRELPAEEFFAVESHLAGCPPCASEAAALDELAAMMRGVAHASGADRADLRGLQADILSRVRQEYDATWPARLQRFWDDMHLVWIGMAAAAASLVCGTLMAGMLHYASPERNDSLAAMLQAMASRDPYMQLPSPGDVVPASLMDSIGEDEAVLALSAMVSREGRVNGLELVSNQQDREHVEQLLDAVSRARFQPAQQAGSPVPVNMVWLLTRTTVRGKQHL
ncbi:MAG TPA: zf-HC2 domain-containing protein [Vicinamibacterales bacterium]|nr:zf-HC2 domain-containing protein [Vicinamibacterales bacterium]